MKNEYKRLREQIVSCEDLLQERAREIFTIHQELKKYTSKLDIVERETREVQTDLCFKNEKFTTTMDQILLKKTSEKLKKVTKLMNKATSNVTNFQPMPKKELMDLIQGMYIKKSMEINTKAELHPKFDDFVYSVLVQRFGTKKKVDQKGQEFFLALREYASSDERISFFKHFVGVEESYSYSREILELYLRFMK